jgi:hypothetical protein blinB_20147
VSDPYFPFRPDLWWPDLFEPLSPAEREELIEGLAVNWHEGWVPNRADVEDYLALTAGTTTLDELVQRYRDQATARRAADRASAPAARG